MKEEITLTLNMRSSVFYKTIKNVKSSKIELVDDMVVIDYTKDHLIKDRIYLPKVSVLCIEVKYYVE